MLGFPEFKRWISIYPPHSSAFEIERFQVCWIQAAKFLLRFRSLTNLQQYTVQVFLESWTQFHDLPPLLEGSAALFAGLLIMVRKSVDEKFIRMGIKKIMEVTPGAEILKLQDTEDDGFALEDEFDYGDVQTISN